jgi:hypothetical protein
VQIKQQINELEGIAKVTIQNVQSMWRDEQYEQEVQLPSV